MGLLKAPGDLTGQSCKGAETQKEGLKCVTMSVRAASGASYRVGPANIAKWAGGQERSETRPLTARGRRHRVVAGWESRTRGSLRKPPQRLRKQSRIGQGVTWHLTSHEACPHRVSPNGLRSARAQGTAAAEGGDRRAMAPSGVAVLPQS